MTDHVIYMAQAYTWSDLETKLSATRWPSFSPQAERIVIKGGTVSVMVRVNAQASKSASASTSSWSKTTGEGYSKAAALNTRGYTLPATLHGTIFIDNASGGLVETEASAQVGWVGTNFPTININKSEQAKLAYEVEPQSLSATTPSGIPSSGIYIVAVRTEESKWDGYVKVYARTLDASNLS